MWKTVFFRGLAGATGIVSSWKRGLGCSDIIPSHQEPVESLSHPPTHPPTRPPWGVLLVGFRHHRMPFTCCFRFGGEAVAHNSLKGECTGEGSSET